MIGTLVRHIIEKNLDVKVKAIMATINKQFQYAVSYRKALYRKQKALIDIYGEWKLSYANLLYYMVTLQNANLGTIVLWDFFPIENSDVQILNYIFQLSNHPSKILGIAVL